MTCAKDSAARASEGAAIPSGDAVFVVPPSSLVARLRSLPAGSVVWYGTPHGDPAADVGELEAMFGPLPSDYREALLHYRTRPVAAGSHE